MKILKPIFCSLLVLILLFTGRVNASEKIVWLSNVPPKSLKKTVSKYGMHRLCAAPIKRNMSKGIQIIQWVRSGTSVAHSAYVSIDQLKKRKFNIFCFSPSSKRIIAKLASLGGKSVLKFLDYEEGYFNLYLVTRRVSGDTLYINIAKAELLSHSCRNGHKNVRKAVKPKIFPKDIPFEIVRKRRLNENFHFNISSGDRFTYQPLFYGKPVSGILVNMNTEKGWTKKMTTDDEGNVEVQFIQDYFSKWSEVRKRRIYYYLIYAGFTVPEMGKFQNKPYSYVHYTTSLSDSYYPSRTMYLSKVWGLVIFVVTLIVIAVGIFVFRERRKKPYKEYVFDESE